jgi:phage recombination protein Bet
MDNKALALPQQEIYNREQIELIKNTVAKGATDDELKMFINIAQKYGLDPFVKEIWFIKRVKKSKDKNGNWDYKRLPNGEIDYSNAETIIMTSRDGYLKIAQGNPEFDGIIGFPVKEGDVFEIDAQNYQVTHKFGTKRGKIIGAWAKVDHKHRKPVIVYADFQEYNSDTSNTWKQYPSAMIQKVAEVLALKRQFGISGLVTKEEMKDLEMDDKPEMGNGSTVIEIKPEDVKVNDAPQEPKQNTQETKQDTNEPINKGQIKRINQLIKDKGMDTSSVQFMCHDITGKDSCKNLTKDEADTFITELESYDPFVSDTADKPEEIDNNTEDADFEGSPYEDDNNAEEKE